MFIKATRRSFLLMICGLFLSLHSLSAFAVSISFDLNGYPGQWVITNGAYGGHLIGNQTLDLPVGRHSFHTGQHPTGNFADVFYFNVSEDGSVTSETPLTATGGNGSLELHTRPITIDPGNYTGTWTAGRLSNGNQQTSYTSPMIVGMHFRIQFTFGNPGFEHYIIASVDSNGTPVSLRPAATSISGSTMTFATAPVTIDAGTYSGTYTLGLANNFVNLRGYNSFDLPKDLRFTIRSGSDFLFFDVAADGTVSTPRSDSMSASGSTLTFLTTPLTIDPVNYLGSYAALTLSDEYFINGLQSFSVIKDVEYRIRLAGVDYFKYHVNADGSVTPRNTVAATGSPNLLQFNNVDVNVDPQNFAGAWHLDRVTPWLYGLQSTTLVPGVQYAFRMGSHFLFDVSADGSVSPANNAPADANGNTLILHNEVINIDPGTDTYPWDINLVIGDTIGPATLVVVPQMRYLLRAKGPNNSQQGQFFTVSEPCAVDPTTFTLHDVEYNVTCGQLDGDSDGVPDDTDNCPAEVNPDQLDQDVDGIGNACDADLDGDGFVNGGDNCPATANADQADLDADGDGDACDDDPDGDSVPNANNGDNCPVDANTDQADTDGDGVGDACDMDDDNDTVEDEFDNCKLVANTDQADFDGDGEGDACDGDTDNDGVANEVDACSGTPAGMGVNASGCSGSQHIALLCDRVSFVQHGQYVSCVAHAANDAVSQGLITTKEKSRFVSSAAKNK